MIISRELCAQFHSVLSSLIHHLPSFSTGSVAAIYGGLPYDKQQSMLCNPELQVVVATPGRLEEWRERGVLRLERVEMIVYDEFDKVG